MELRPCLLFKWVLQGGFVASELRSLEIHFIEASLQVLVIYHHFLDKHVVAIVKVRVLVIHLTLNGLGQALKILEIDLGA